MSLEPHRKGLRDSTDQHGEERPCCPLGAPHRSSPPPYSALPCRTLQPLLDTEYMPASPEPVLLGSLGLTAAPWGLERG